MSVCFSEFDHCMLILCNDKDLIKVELNLFLNSFLLKVEVKLTSGETYKGVVIDVDEEKDLAAVKLITKKENVSK